MKLPPSPSTSTQQHDIDITMADLRQACDRCHDKKLRCTKARGAQVCGRCVKAGVPCIFSPPTRSLPHQPDAAAFDWTPWLGLDNPPLGPMNSISSNPQITTPPVSEDTGPAPPNEVSQLTDVMISLDRLNCEFPSTGRHHLSSHQLKDFAQSVSAKFDLQATLEHLLLQAQKLAHVYPQVLKRLKPEDPPCDIPDCLHHTTQALRTGPRLPFDQSLINLLVACHLKILELFDNVVNHARLCGHVTSLLPKDHEPNWDIPEIRIGSFVAPKTSAASMMTAMIIELQSSLTERAQQLNDMVSPFVNNESKEAKIVGLQCEALQEHASTTLNDLRALRDYSIKLGFIA
ncbi:hypothetical protein NM208_g4240 [Fusarium decemcellulare]|uniref:Uncharacterized protein n=2 Tax=Fusarium decemcellulare TaxID=57161 RepID=A0ACC1SLP9_9HYPO|nr:hypothetical protein NM208_g5683 [Fusarium decemcellulare]KAJ3542185.1 hypothetical protein NM208_g4240 [Fusarium decemcellulare]